MKKFVKNIQFVYLRLAKKEVKEFVLSIISKYPNNRVLNNLVGQALLSWNSHIEGLSHIKKVQVFYK